MRTFAISACICLLAAGCASWNSTPSAGSSRGAARAGKPPLDPSRAGRSREDTGGVYSPVPSLPFNAGLGDLLLHASLNNPGLQAAFFRWKAAVEKTGQVTALPDPRLSYSYYIREVETRVGPQRQALALAQTFPWFGKLQLRADAAAQDAQAAWHEFQAEKLALYYRVKKIYSEYYYLGQAVAITRENLELLQQVERLARTRYKAAAASHPDLIRLQVELGKLEDRLATLTEFRRPVLGRLAAALGTEVGLEDLAWPKSLPHRPADTTWDRLVDRMTASNPKLQALARKTAAADRRVALARKDYYPDVTVGLTWIETGDRAGPMSPSDSGQDAVIGMVSLNVPIWWDKLAAAVREARMRRLATQRARKQLAADLAAGLRQILYELQDAQRKITLYQATLLPKAREALKVVQIGFVSGKSSFTDLIDAQRALLEFELSHRRALADHAVRRAALEQILGQPLEKPAPAGPTTQPVQPAG